MSLCSHVSPPIFSQLFCCSSLCGFLSPAFPRASSSILCLAGLNHPHGLSNSFSELLTSESNLIMHLTSLMRDTSRSKYPTQNHFLKTSFSPCIPSRRLVFGLLEVISTILFLSCHTSHLFNTYQICLLYLRP